MGLEVDIIKPCDTCAFREGWATCKINNENKYIHPLTNKHCDNYLLKGLYSEEDEFYELQDKQRQMGLTKAVANKR